MAVTYHLGDKFALGKYQFYVLGCTGGDPNGTLATGVTLINLADGSRWGDDAIIANSMLDSEAGFVLPDEHGIWGWPGRKGWRKVEITIAEKLEN